MKIMSVYQAHTKDADGKLPKCDYISEGCYPNDMARFEASADLLAACKRLLDVMDMQEKREREEYHITQDVALGIWNDAKDAAKAAIAKAEGPCKS